MSDHYESTPALGNWIGYVTSLVMRFKSVAPYALIELILPGGSVMAFLLWLYRRRKNRIGVRAFPGNLLSSLRLSGPLHTGWRRVSLGVVSILKAIVSTTRHLGIGWV
jgi:hypothetical protein